jgi:ERCC4-type nuclease
MSYILKIDDREVKTDEKEKKDERNKIPRELFDIEASKKIIDVMVKRLYTGDYAFNYMEVLLMNFERKTPIDLASSMKDGRLSQQIENMEKLRNETGCMIGFIIEGTIKGEHGHITSKQLHAKLLSITINHNIPVLYTQNMQDTVKLLFQMIDLYNIDENLPRLVEIQKKDNIDLKNIDPCLKPRERTLESMAIECISAIPNVSESTSKVILKKWSILELLTQKLTTNDFSELKYPSSGAKFGEARAKTLIQNLRREDTMVKILESVNGVTKPNAKRIVALNVFDINSIANITKVNKEGKVTDKKIGKVVAERIINVFTYKKINVVNDDEKNNNNEI